MNMIFTTSWDDGNKLDMKLASLMSKYKIKGTFYIPINWKYRSLSDKDIKKLSMKFEIGSHSFSHKDMRKLDSKELYSEIIMSKSTLEKMIKTEIRSFAYPFGHFNDKIVDAVKKSGFLYARTARELQTDFSKDNLKSDITISLMNRHRGVFLFKNIISSLTNKLKWEEVARELLLDVQKKNGVFHLQGHSWEIENEGNWDSLIQFFDMVSKLDDVNFVSNGDLVSTL